MLTQATESRELVLADLVDDIMRRMQAGEPIDIAALTNQHPDLAGRLGELQPAVQLLAELRQHKELFAEANSIAANAASVQSRREHLQPGGEIASTGILGDFRLVREIGRGGMGVVFEAEQISLGRTVALKMLPYAGVLDEKHLQRFKNEARAAATLEHPHIVPVYSIGCERGVHFFTMRFIEGQSLAEVLQAIPAYRAGVLEAAPSQSGLASQLAKLFDRTQQSLKPPSADTKSNLSSSKLDTQRVVQAGITTDPVNDSPAYIHKVARLGIQAAEALAYAHERGILHRDVKPGNLLLDVQGDLWVADFGLARLEQDAGITITGDVLGTLRYMSPEQALGQTAVLDERADVYSLGVTLYEMLTLRPAFAGRDRQEILRRIATEEPQPPREIDPRIPRDLETIVLKAMGKEVANRYQTAGQLADDLRRYLDHKPIQARRPTAVEKAVKWSRRHPAFLWATVLVLLTTTIISAASSLLITQAYRREADSAQHAREAAVSANNATLAEAAQRQKAEASARQAAAVSKFLVNAFRSPDPQRDGRTITIAEILDRSTKDLQNTFSDDPPTKAAMLLAFADAYQGLGLYRDAIPVLETTRDQCVKTLGPVNPTTLDSMLALIESYVATGRTQDAIALATEARSACKAAPNPPLETDLRSLCNLAAAYEGADRFDLAIPLLQEAFAKAKSKPDCPYTTEIMGNIGDALSESGKTEEGLALLAESFARAKNECGADYPRTLAIMHNLASAYLRAGHFEGAIPMMIEVIELRKRVLGPLHPDTLQSMGNLGAAYFQAGQPEKAIPFAEETLGIMREHFGTELRQTQGIMRQLGVIYRSAGRLDDAIAMSVETLKLEEAQDKPNDPKLLQLKKYLSSLYLSAQRPADAIPLYRELLTIYETDFGPEDSKTVDLMNDLAEVYLTAAEPAEAEALIRKCLAIREKNHPDDWDTFFARVSLGTALYEQDNNAAAEPLLLSGYEGMVSRFDKIPDGDKGFVDEALQRIVLLYEDMKQPEKVVQWKRKLDEFDNADAKRKSDK